MRVKGTSYFERPIYTSHSFADNEYRFGNTMLSMTPERDKRIAEKRVDLRIYNVRVW